MGRVFILEEARRHLDTSSAARYGDITYLFDPGERRPSVFQVQEFVESVHAALVRKAFDPDEDSWVIVGSMLNTSIAMLALAAYATGRTVQLLLFNARAEPGQEYERKEVSLAITPVTES